MSYSYYGEQCSSSSILGSLDSSVNQLRGYKNSMKEGMRDIDRSIYDLDDDISKNPDKAIREASQNSQTIQDNMRQNANYGYNAIQCAKKMSDGCANSVLGTLTKNANNIINAAMTVAALSDLTSTKGKLSSLAHKVLVYGTLLKALGVTDLIQKIDELIGCSQTFNDIKPDVLDGYMEEVNYIQDDLYLNDDGEFEQSSFLDKKMEMFSSLSDSDMISSLKTSILDSTETLSIAGKQMQDQSKDLLKYAQNDKLSSNILPSDWF